jgi:hypothetical protein
MGSSRRITAAGMRAVARRGACAERAAEHGSDERAGGARERGQGRLALREVRVDEWIRRNGRERTGIRWELYRDWSDDEKKIRTDVFWALKPE